MPRSGELKRVYKNGKHQYVKIMPRGSVVSVQEIAKKPEIEQDGGARDPRRPSVANERSRPTENPAVKKKLMADISKSILSGNKKSQKGGRISLF